jgi:acyl-CoA thioester hydrolase
MEPVHRFQFVVPESAVDRNGHVNNVAYIQWMQDAAIQHSKVSGGTQLTRTLGATWVVRTHHVEYLSPAFAGDDVIVVTWVANFRKVRSLRRYKIIRAKDRKVLAEGETGWVFVDARSGRPRAIPQEIADCFGVSDKEPEV